MTAARDLYTRLYNGILRDNEQSYVISDVITERCKQLSRWGCQDHVTPHQWLAILTEELGEVAHDLAEQRMCGFLAANYRTELVQLAACAVAAIEAYDATVSSASTCTAQ